MADKSKDSLNKIKASRVILPILLGLGVVVFLLYKEFRGKDLDSALWDYVRLDAWTVFWLFVALVCMASRDLGYILRIRILSDNFLSWKKAFRVIMLWEFTSAITPSAIGGTSVAILYVNKEGLSIGRSSSIVMATSFLDELYFIIMFPILYLVLNPVYLFVIDQNIVTADMSYINQFFWFAIIGYGLKLLYVLVLSYGLFVNSRGLKWLILKIFKLPILRRWKHEANKAGSEIIVSAKELKQKSVSFWLRAFGATFFSWTARYWVVNVIFVAFAVGYYTLDQHFLIFARQLVMWIMMLIMPTPGGSGAAELIFTKFLGSFIPVAGLAVFLSLIWRIATYYPYLFIGAFVFPRWLKNNFGKSTKNN